MDEDFAHAATRLVVEATNGAIRDALSAQKQQPAPAELDAYARLHLLHGKQFGAASSISHFGGEPILRLVVEGTGQFVFQVGPYIVMPPPAIFCACTAFQFAAVSRQSSWGCKHILALSLALQLDAPAIETAAAAAAAAAVPPLSVVSSAPAHGSAVPSSVGATGVACALLQRNAASLTIREKSITRAAFADLLAA